MHSHGTIPVSLLLLLAVAFQATVTATPLLTVACDEPQGADISYGSGLLGLQEPTVDTSAVVYPGLHPTFLIDEDTPQRLRVTFGDGAANQAPPSDPTPPFEASILYATDDGYPINTGQLGYDRRYKPCHDFLYISGAFRRLCPVGTNAKSMSC